MKHILVLIAITAFISKAGAQTEGRVPERILSHADSVKVHGYWRKANQVRLGSEARQRYLDSALAIAPWNAYFWQQKAMPLSKAMKHELAAPFLDSAVKYNPGRYLEYRAFMNCIFRKSYRAALQDFYAAYAINGNSGVMDHPYDFYMGLCHLQLNNMDSARYLFHKCIEEKTKKLGADWVHYLHWFYLGVTWWEENNYERAIEIFDEALRLNPTFPDAIYYKALCLSAKGYKEEALTGMYQVDSLLKKGYSMNEDHTRYETYPYQLRKYALEQSIKYLEEDMAD